MDLREKRGWNRYVTSYYCQYRLSSVTKVSGISLQTLNTRVCQECPEFEEKSRCAREATPSRFLKKHLLTMRVCSHASQKHPGEEHRIAELFMATIVPSLAGIDRRLVLNMDQSTVV